MGIEKLKLWLRLSFMIAAPGAVIFYGGAASAKLRA